MVKRFSSLLLLVLVGVSLLIVASPLFLRQAHAVSSATVYVGSGDGTVSAFNATTGAERWSYPTGGSVLTKPAFANGILYVDSLDSGANSSHVYALNAQTGALLWRYKTDPLLTNSPVLVVSEGIIYIGSADRIYALHAQSGKLIWQTGGSETPVVDNGAVYSLGSNGIQALNAQTGSVLWYTPVYATTPALSGNILYTGNTALNAQTGAILWQANVDPADPPATDGNRVYLVGHTGIYSYALFVLDAHTGAVLKRIDGKFLFAVPVLMNGLVAIGSLTGYVSVLHAATGTFLWRYLTGGSVYNSLPYIASGLVYVGSNDGSLYALKDGTLVWKQHKTKTIFGSPLVV